MVIVLAMTELIRVLRHDPNWKGLCDVARRSFRNWDPSPLSDECREYYILQKSGNIVGTVTADIGEETDAYLNDVAIHPHARRQGLGLEMMAHLDRRLSSRFQMAWLMTEPKNIDFYHAAGFVRDGTSTAISMVMMLKRYG
ncbi:MAG: hypothetical protein DI586_03225 [Micavibrio aeruginosavorus]|uniref:N-acetyltransferase domain-containing protein n=1 Tax=Micavibrio aeruginosavorus TaxID=349221 RepID=A0A2W5HLR6_9BACT|nr:MAG: hypothetical protein DI586_03225 [Micavibrio aeruginosavorus]